MTDTQTPPTLAMEQAIACLAVELPAEVWEDVRDRWHAARDALVASYEQKVEEFAAETRRNRAYIAIEDGHDTWAIYGPNYSFGTVPLHCHQEDRRYVKLATVKGYDDAHKVLHQLEAGRS